MLVTMITAKCVDINDYHKLDMLVTMITANCVDTIGYHNICWLQILLQNVLIS